MPSRIRTNWYGLLAIAAAISVAAALLSERGIIAPDLARLYVSSRSEAEQPPVIVIPGILGSHIVDAQGHELWPGSLIKAAFSRYQDLTLTIDPATLEPELNGQHATDLTDVVAGHDFYGSIVRTLEHAGGYVAGIPGTPVQQGKRYYYLFAYDWRLDNVESARALGRLIDQIRVDHDRPDLKVDIIAHSMGGLIARYYLRYGDADVLDGNDFPMRKPGADRVRRLALLGTPSLGSISALHAFLSGYPIGLQRMPTEVLATFPSLSQLFPHPFNDWIIDAHGAMLPRDVFSVDLWRDYHWSIFDPRVRERILANYADAREGEAYLSTLERYFAKRLERARRFVWSLTVSIDRAPWKMVAFGGDCSLTPARLLVEAVDGESVVRMWPSEISAPAAGVDYDRLMLEPGDGVVTKASLLARESLDPSVPRNRWSYFPLAYAQFLCERHDALTTNVFFQDNVLQFLLSRDEK